MPDGQALNNLFRDPQFQSGLAMMGGGGGAAGGQSSFDAAVAAGNRAYANTALGNMYAAQAQMLQQEAIRRRMQTQAYPETRCAFSTVTGAYTNCTTW
jgi:citrate lyase alpha subunit